MALINLLGGVSGSPERLYYLSLSRKFLDQVVPPNAPKGPAPMDCLISLQIYFLFIITHLIDSPLLFFYQPICQLLYFLFLHGRNKHKYILRYRKMIKKQLKAILDPVNERLTSPHKGTIHQNTAKINCDQLINAYLHFSLSGQIKDQLKFTKDWMNNNKNMAKMAVRRAEKELQKSLDQKTRPIQQFFDSGSKNMNNLIKPKQVNLKVKMFNQQKMQQIITERQKSEEKCKKKINHLKNIDNYLRQISKLNFKKTKEARGKQNDLTCNQSNQRLRMRTKASVCKKTEQSAIENKTYDLFNCKSLNSSGFQKKSLQTPKIGPFQLETVADYHPFLQKDSAMLYESKKKNYQSKKFRLNKHKVSIYY